MAYFARIGSSSFPAEGDTVRVLLAGSTAGSGVLLANLEDKDGNALANPLTVVDTDGLWSVRSRRSPVTVDLWWEEGAAYLVKGFRLAEPGDTELFTSTPADPRPNSLYTLVNSVVDLTPHIAVATDGTITFTFTEAVSGVTYTGDATGTITIHDGTGYVPGSVATADNIIYVVTPSGALTEGATLTIGISTAVVAAASATQFYDGKGFYLGVTEATPDTTAPTVTTFTVTTPVADTKVIPITAFTATDDRAVAGYKVTESATPPLAGDAGWTASAPTDYTLANFGSSTLYPWAKDAAGNVSTVFGSPRAVTATNAAPVVTGFDLPATAASLTVTVNTFTATDNVAVTGYLITESASTPAVDNPNWSGSVQTEFTFSADGSQTAYAWAKDAAGNISASASDSVTITLPVNSAPTFSVQPAEDSVTSSSITLSYTSADVDGDNLLVEYSTDNGTSWQTAVASEAPGAHTYQITTLSTDGTTPLSAATQYTCKLRLDDGTAAAVESNAVVSTTSAAGSAIAWDFTLSGPTINGGGTTLDDTSSYNDDLTLVGLSTGWSQVSAQEVRAESGTYAKIEVADAPQLNAGGAFTACVVYNRRTSPGGVKGIFNHHHYNGSTYNGWGVIDNGGAGVYFLIGNNSANKVYAAAGEAAAANTFMVLFARYDGTTWRCYVNDTEVYSEAVGAGYNNAHNGPFFVNAYLENSSVTGKINVDQSYGECSFKAGTVTDGEHTAEVARLMTKYGIA